MISVATNRPRHEILPNFETGHIAALNFNCLPIATIARYLSHSRTFVTAFMKNIKDYNKTNRRGRSRKVEKEDRRKLITKKYKELIGFLLLLTLRNSQEKHDVLENICRTRVIWSIHAQRWQWHCANTMKKGYFRAKGAMISGQQEGENIVSSDKTMFNSDGPDGLPHDLLELRNEKQFWF